MINKCLILFLFSLSLSFFFYLTLCLSLSRPCISRQCATRAVLTRPSTPASHDPNTFSYAGCPATFFSLGYNMPSHDALVFGPSGATPPAGCAAVDLSPSAIASATSSFLNLPVLSQMVIVLLCLPPHPPHHHGGLVVVHPCSCAVADGESCCSRRGDLFQCHITSWWDIPCLLSASRDHAFSVWSCRSRRRRSSGSHHRPLYPPSAVGSAAHSSPIRRRSCIRKMACKPDVRRRALFWL